ncbi:uncharacterized protein LOC143450627 isoform X2 [Clavelina lepadiformis]|uniref:BHLH domain-containing protein n=1 Tax=Clavelina lepadiformis TaxID=159417 RepID=A0ABP0H2A8_CLALP
MITVATPTTCPPGSSGSLNLPGLASICAQNIEPRVIAVAEDVALTDIYGQREQDRKVRREIANSNERRRMQSINAGFKSLKTILPHSDGDKLSKAAILQQTAEYIFQLENDKLKLLDQNEKYRRALLECKCNNPKQRALIADVSEKDEGIGSPREEDLEDIRKDAIEVRQQLDKERRLRMVLEEKIRSLEAQIYPEKLREIAQTVTQQHRKGVTKVLNKVEAKETNGVIPIPNIPESMQIVSAKLISQDQKVPVYEKDERVTAVKTSPVLPYNTTSLTPLQLVQPHVQPSPDIAPPPALCVTIAQDVDVETSCIQSKSSVSVPRSRQPLKKRAIEPTHMSETSSPLNKVPKIAVGMPVQETNFAVAKQAPLSSPSSHTYNAVLSAQPPISSNASTIQTINALPNTLSVQGRSIQTTIPLQHSIATLPAELEQVASSVIAAQQQITIASPPINQVMLTNNPHSATHTYMTLTPAYSAGKPVWQEQLLTPTTPHNCQVSIAAVPSKPANASQYILQPTIQRVQPKTEEMTLNQLNTVPPLSMTLTQLNAVPTMSRLCSSSFPGNVTLPGSRIQTQYLPLVPMDKVLRVRGERSMSNTTTDSAATVSDEESKCVFPEEHANVENVSIVRSTRSSSDPCPGDKTQKPEIKASLSNPAMLSMLSDGPGSPPLLRHIDAVTTRRNLETIVQAIDHLEQQERRNSQDQQPIHINELHEASAPV